MRQIAENFGTARAMLVALGVAMGLAGCQPGTQGAYATPKDLPAKTLAHVLQSRPSADDARGCFTELKGPAKVETVTGQVEVIPEQRDPKTGKVTQPAIYRELSGQKLVDSGKPRYFESVCSEDLTPAFVAMTQRALALRGLYSGPADGKLDPATGRAIAAYQAPRGLDSPTLSVRAAQELGLYIWSD
ncbi:hypothetical protein B6V74_02810 [Thioclava sp. F42-5]|uniref:peptidoglycan-binding domain-containing protein n=1 Tax=Thioclava sp. F42-5 TaxID=1973005 RepID=UPI000B53D02A|nr:peptidoglycan-binding domain-containing protein [Thioclava sp. F42-5]OWY10971.1 hypothetical protein B6V74_02810 [Thioclava sp. F42-5]